MINDLSFHNTLSNQSAQHKANSNGNRKRQFPFVVVFSIACFSAVAATQIPELDHPWTDGLYSTVTMPFCTGGIAPRNAKATELHVDGMKSDIVTRAVIQEHPAPLVVIINGTFGNVNSPETGLLMAWIEERGFHAFTFDSTFGPAMAEASGHGVSGNLMAEAELTGRIIHAFMQQCELCGKITKVGIVGMSYGATQALLLEKLQREGRLSFDLDAVQAYSPPVNIAASLRILDDAAKADWTWKETFWVMCNLWREEPLREKPDARKMRAALGHYFQIGLKEVVAKNDRLFGSEMNSSISCSVRPKCTELEQRTGVTFNQYLRNTAEPYWQARGVNNLLAVGELPRLLSDCGVDVEVIVTLNDPLNDPCAIEELQATSAKKLTVLPRGGHLGYINAQWTRTKICNIFNSVELALGKKSRNTFSSK
jgi:predicted alpha/beta-fold hydrolase